MANGWHTGPLLAALILLAPAAVPLASAAPWSPTFTVAEPRSGDSGLYSPGRIVVDDETEDTEGLGFAFELGNRTQRTDAYGVDRNATPFRAYLVAEDRAFELPITTWVHARAEAPLARDVHLTGALAGGQDATRRDVDFASRHASPHGPECLFLTGLQGRTLQEDAELPLRELCGQDLDLLADEENATVQARVAEVADLEDGGEAVRVLLTAEHPDGSLEADLWYKDEIPYPVEINLEGHVARAVADDAEAEGDTSGGPTPLLALLEPFEPWLDGHGDGGEGNESSFEASIELERFHRGDGPVVPAREGPRWPSWNRALETAEATRWGPPSGGPAFDYARDEAVQALLDDPTLTEFQAWWNDHPEARALGAAYEVTEGQGERRQTWTFLVAGDDEEGWRLTSQRTDQARAGDQPLLEPPAQVADNDAEQVEVDPSTFDLEPPDALPTLASLVDAWAARDPDTSAEHDANRFRWTDADAKPWPREGPLVEVGWRDPDQGVQPGPGAPPPGAWSENRSTLTVHPEDGALLGHERTQVDTSEAWLGGAGGDDVAWPGMSFRGAGAEPAALDAPTVVGIATASTLLLVALAVVKVGAGIPLYSRLSREDLLDHPTRRAAYEALNEDEGLTLREVADAADCAPSTARYHLRRLADADLVVAADGGAGTRWFASGGLSPDAMAKQAALEVGDSREVYEALKRNPGASLTELAEILGTSPPAAHKIVDRLVEAGLVDKQRDGRKVALFAREAAVTSVE